MADLMGQVQTLQDKFLEDKTIFLKLKEKRDEKSQEAFQRISE